MKGLVFLITGSPFTDSELWIQPTDWLGEALSQQMPVWRIQLYLDDSSPAYHLKLWGGWGRAITFWGDWRLEAAMRVVASYWQAEGFEPGQVIYLGEVPIPLLNRWAKRSGVHLRDFTALPTTECLWLPYSGVGEPHPWLSKLVTIPVTIASAEAAQQLAEWLIREGFSVYLIGITQAITPFRRLASRFGERVGLYFGLPWLEVEALISQSMAVVLPAIMPHHQRLSWGRPVFYPGPERHERSGLFPYESLSDLKSRLSQVRDLATVESLSPSEAAARWLRWLQVQPLPLPEAPTTS